VKDCGWESWYVKDGVWQSCVWKMCVKDSVWQSCVWKIMCNIVVVWHSGVWNSVWQSGVWKIVGEKVGMWKMVCDKVVCERRWVTKLWRGGGGGGGGGRGRGIQNQKQEPHTKMWGIIITENNKVSQLWTSDRIWEVSPQIQGQF
jgi:hypothetical protein